MGGEGAINSGAVPQAVALLWVLTLDGETYRHGYIG